jgi:hypothetical protein
VFRRAKQFASERGISFTSLVEESLRERMNRVPTIKRRKTARLPAFHGTGLLPGVNLDKSGDILDRMDNG